MKALEKALLKSYAAVGAAVDSLGKPSPPPPSTLRMVVETAKAALQSTVVALIVEGESPGKWRGYGVPLMVVEAAKLRLASPAAATPDIRPLTVDDWGAVFAGKAVAVVSASGEPIGLLRKGAGGRLHLAPLAGVSIERTRRALQAIVDASSSMPRDTFVAAQVDGGPPRAPRAPLTITDGGHEHTLTVTNGARFYARSAGPEDGVAVRSVFYRTSDWEFALGNYAGRFPAMVAMFGKGPK